MPKWNTDKTYDLAWHRLAGTGKQLSTARGDCMMQNIGEVIT